MVKVIQFNLLCCFPNKVHCEMLLKNIKMDIQESQLRKILKTITLLKQN